MAYVDTVPFDEAPPTLDHEWLATWDWGDLDCEQAICGAGILWEQIVNDVAESRPFFFVGDKGVAIAIGILGEKGMEEHVVVLLDEITVINEPERLAVAAGLWALAFKIAHGAPKP